MILNRLAEAHVVSETGAETETRYTAACPAELPPPPTTAVAFRQTRVPLRIRDRVETDPLAVVGADSAREGFYARRASWAWEEPRDEDDAEDTIRPRLEAAGADLKRVHILDAVRETNKDGASTTRPFSLTADIERLAIWPGS